jgi:hypothetical protein
MNQNNDILNPTNNEEDREHKRKIYNRWKCLNLCSILFIIVIFIMGGLTARTTMLILRQHNEIHQREHETINSMRYVYLARHACEKNASNFACITNISSKESYTMIFDAVNGTLPVSMSDVLTEERWTKLQHFIINNQEIAMGICVLAATSMLCLLYGVFHWLLHSKMVEAGERVKLSRHHRRIIDATTQQHAVSTTNTQQQPPYVFAATTTTTSVRQENGLMMHASPTPLTQSQPLSYNQPAAADNNNNIAYNPYFENSILSQRQGYKLNSVN